MTGIGKSNLEFQEYVIKDLYFGQKFRKTGDDKYFKGISTTEKDEYSDFLDKALGVNGKICLIYLE